VKNNSTGRVNFVSLITILQAEPHTYLLDFLIGTPLLAFFLRMLQHICKCFEHGDSCKHSLLCRDCGVAHLLDRSHLGCTKCQ